MKPLPLCMIAVTLGLSALFYNADAAEIEGTSAAGQVTSFGGYQQSVRVTVPTYHGLEPEVGLEYVDGGRDGMAGWSWRIRGWPTITRSTNRTGLPRFTADDQFSLDGTLLIPCSDQVPGGISCQSGGTHGLERETYQRVRQVGGGWAVWDRNGTVSRFNPLSTGGRSDVRFGLAERTDTHGNQLTYTHWCDGTDECYPKAIEYKDHSDVQRRTRIEYRWEVRPDPYTYAQGSPQLVTVRYRLQSIVVSTNNAIRGAIGLEYQQSRSGRWAGASRLQTVTRYGRDVKFDATGRITGGSRLPSERFSYESEPTVGVLLQAQTIATGVSTTPPAATGPFAPYEVATGVPWGPLPVSATTDPFGSQQWLALDVNADGLTDAVAIVHDGNSNPGTVRIFTYLSRGDGSYRTAVEQTMPWAYYLPLNYNSPQGHEFLTGDFNGDGLPDLLALWADPTTKQVVGQVAFGAGDRFGPPVPLSLSIGHWSDLRRFLVGDFDGDHRDDLVIADDLYELDKSRPSQARVTLLRSNGTTLEAAASAITPWSFQSGDLPYWFVGDHDGDGRADIIRVETTFDGPTLGARLGIARLDGSGGFLFSTIPTPLRNWTPIQGPTRFGNRPVGADLAQIGDFDANGLTDVVLFTAYGPSQTINYWHLHATVLLSQPSGGVEVREQHLQLEMERQNSFSVRHETFPNRWLATDFDGDGATDLVLVTPPNTWLAPSWPQSTLVIRLRSQRDGTFADVGLSGATTVAVPFDCWNRGTNYCTGGPMFDVLPAELNGDGNSDLLFVQYAHQSGRVRLFGEPSRVAPGPERGWRLADVTGDGRNDFVRIELDGSGVVVRSALSAADGSPSPQIVVTRIPAGSWVGIDPRRWFVADVGSPTNGAADGKADLVYVGTDLAGNNTPVTTQTLVLLSNGDGTFTPRPSSMTNVSPSHRTAGWRLVDLNADGRMDLVRVSASQLIEVALARGDGSWNYRVVRPTGIPTGVPLVAVQAADIDGDGRGDLVIADTVTTGTTHSDRVVTLRGEAGNTFSTSVWQGPHVPVPSRTWRLADMNGDGRADLVAVSFGTGTGVIHIRHQADAGATWLDSSAVTSLRHVNQASLRIIDLDSDGCQDFVWPTTDFALDTRARGLLNRCNGRYEEFDDRVRRNVRDSSTLAVAPWGPNLRPALFRMDESGPGTVTAWAYGREFGRPLLTGTDNGIGLNIGITYGTSAGALGETAFGNPKPVVTEVRGQVFPTASSSGVTSVYRYENARWSNRTRGFLGFGRITVSEGTTLTSTTYKQSDGCATRPTRIEVASIQGIFWADTRTYDDTSLAPSGTAPWSCELKTTARETCELGSSCRTSLAQEHDYDAYGNQVESRGWGDPTTATDDRVVRRRFFPNVAAYLVSAVAEIETLDTGGARVALSRTVFDDAASYADMPVRGDPTRLESWDSTTGGFRVTQRHFDAAGNETEKIDAAGRSVRTDWDPDFARFPWRRCNSIWCERTEWDLVLGVKTAGTDANGQTTRHQSDALARHWRTDYPDGGCLLHQYLDWGAASSGRQRTLEIRCTASSTQDAQTGGSRHLPTGGLQQVRYFDGMQRIWKEERSGGYERTRSFDGWTERVTRESLWRSAGQLSQSTRYLYDDAHRVRVTVLPDGQRRITNVEVDRVIENSPAGGRRVTDRDGWGRIAAVSDDMTVGGNRVSAGATYRYDALDRLVLATDPNGHQSSWEYNSLGWLRSECDPDRGCRTREFDPTGIPTLEVDALRQRITYTPDVLGRIVKRAAYDSSGALVESVVWQYDHPRTQTSLKNVGLWLGRVVSVSSSNGTSSSFTYDPLGRVRTEEICITQRCVNFRTDWDRVGRPERLTYPDPNGALSARSEVVDFRYDTAGRPKQVGAYVSDVQYDPDDAIAVIRFNNGVVQRIGRDPARRWVSSMDVIGPLGAGLPGSRGLIAHWGYGYDADGRVESELRSGLVNSQRSFHYDPAGRIERVVGARPDTFEYDRAGNLLRRASVGRFDYTDPNHPNAVTDVAGSPMVYDSVGQLATRAGVPLKWDPHGRLTQTQWLAGLVDFEFFWDGAVARRRDANGDRMSFSPRAELQANGEWKYRYFLGAQIIAERSSPGSVRFLHRDRLGSVTEVTDAGGAAVELFEYDAFGTSIVRFGGAIDQRFAGGREDADIALIELGARWLDPWMGRFISPDPTLPNSHRPTYLNRYVYARNNPLNVVDPSGLAPSDESADEALERVLRAIVRVSRPISAETTNLKNSTSPVAKDPLDVEVHAAIDQRLHEVLVGTNVRAAIDRSLKSHLSESVTKVLRRHALADFSADSLSASVKLYKRMPEENKERLKEYAIQTFWNSFHIWGGAVELDTGHSLGYKGVGAASIYRGFEEQIHILDEIPKQKPAQTEPAH